MPKLARLWGEVAERERNSFSQTRAAKSWRETGLAFLSGSWSMARYCGHTSRSETAAQNQEGTNFGEESGAQGEEKEESRDLSES